jgi:hypothetical protein
MPTLNNASFAHRPNKDGSFDSVCRRCYMTAARSDKEAKLESQELLHHCNQDMLAMREAAVRQLAASHRG